MNYLSDLDNFILTNDPLYCILGHLDVESLYSMLFVCKFYYNNFRVKEVMKRIKIETLLDVNNLAANNTYYITEILDTNGKTNKLLDPAKTFLYLINPLLFDYQMRIYYGGTAIVVCFYDVPYLFPRCSPGVGLNSLAYNIQISVKDAAYYIQDYGTHIFWTHLDDDHLKFVESKHPHMLINDTTWTYYTDITKLKSVVLDIFKYSTTLKDFTSKYKAFMNL